MVNQVTMSLVVLVKVLLIIIFVVLMTIIIISSCKYCRRSARTLLTATSGSSWRRVSTSCWSSSSGKKEPPLRSSWLWQYKGFIEFYASLISILPPQNMNFQFSWNSRNLQIWKLKLENLIKKRAHIYLISHKRHAHQTILTQKLIFLSGEVQETDWVHCPLPLPTS